MSNPGFQAFTEEAFVQASLKEFVKLWGSGSQAFFQLQCVDGQASLKFSSQLGAPADFHFHHHRYPHHLHGFHAEQPHHHPRKNSKKQQDRDRVRAAAHQADKQLNVEKPAVTAAKESSAGTQPSPPPGSGEDAPKPPPSIPPKVVAPPAATFLIPPNPKQAVPAAPAPFLSSNSAVPAHPKVILSEVRDELVSEETEVKVLATGIFENCPDNNLSEDYYESLRKFILSEKHLEENISSVKFAKLPS